MTGTRANEHTGQPDLFTALLGRAEALKKGDDAAVKSLIGEMLALPLSDERCDMFTRAAAKASGFALATVRGLVRAERLRREQEARATPEAQEVERAARAAAEAATTIVRDAERERLWRSCQHLAGAPNLMNCMEAVAHRLGVVGERAAIRGVYLAMTSRLLKDNAISMLRRGAPSSGKNFLIGVLCRLIPKESVIAISSASPMALIYHGDDDNALAHTVIVVAEAAAVAQKINGDENVMAIMLRTLLSEGRIDREVALASKDGQPKTVHVCRNGPVSLLLTSARENVDQEMMTRLMTSDADESRAQTLATVKQTLLRQSKRVTKEEMEPWLDLQRWLAFDLPYDVAVPFAAAIYEAYKLLIDSLPNALQVRMRRDITGLLAAVRASAVLHRARRQIDAEGHIVAELADYRHAWNAFNQSVSSLYEVRTRPEIVAAVQAAEALGAVKGGESVKITVAALRKELGINSNDVADSRLREAVESGALKEDDGRRGLGRGSPRFFELLKTSHELRTTPTLGVFPAPSLVKKCFEARVGSEDGGQDGRNGQDGQGERSGGLSCPPHPSCPPSSDPSLPQKKLSAPEAEDHNNSIAARIVADFDALDFKVVLTPSGALAIEDLQGGLRQYARTPPKHLQTLFSDHADEIGRWLEGGGTI
jgi:hypothetical protein